MKRALIVLLHRFQSGVDGALDAARFIYSL